VDRTETWQRGTARFIARCLSELTAQLVFASQESEPVQTWQLWWLCCCDTQGIWQTSTTLILNASPDSVSLCILYLAKALWKASNIQPTIPSLYIFSL
jgi:hypothetical protein